MRESYIEGVAIHDGPESCVGDRKAGCEALTGARAGWAIEPRNHGFGVPTSLTEAEGNTGVRATASAPRAPRGRRTCARTESPCARTGRSCGHLNELARAGREGKAEAASPR